MTPELRALLAPHDHPTECEYPPGFAYRASLARVKALVPTLQPLAGVPLKLDDTVQDATYFCDVACYREISPRMFVPVVRIVFSMFGDLVSIVRADDFDPAALTRLVTALGEAGYIYVPADDLDVTYDGANTRLVGQTTWWERFFSYL